jgi:hypothetical protein
MSELGKAGIMAIVLAFSAPEAVADEALIKAIGKLLSVAPSESPGEMIEGSLVDFSVGTDWARGIAVTPTDDPCVVERLSVVQSGGSRPGVGVYMEVYDFGRVECIESDDPESSVIVLEGEGWHCAKALSLDRQHFQSGCSDMVFVNAADQDRAAALAALQVIRESCALP